MKTIDIDYLRSILSYDEEIGLIFWKINKNSRARKGAVAGCLALDGYWQIRIDSATHRAHRIAWALHYGKFPELLVDHINGVRHDNRISNLRLCDHYGNSRNKGVSKRSKSGVKGVYWNKQLGKWHAQIEACGLQRHLGFFTDIEEARIAYINASNLHHGEFARYSLN